MGIAGEVLESNNNLNNESYYSSEYYLYVPLLSLLFLDIQCLYWFLPGSHHFDDENLQKQKIYI